MTSQEQVRVTQADAPFVAVEGQSFASHQHWVLYATRRLTAHPDYNNTEHNGPAKGWRGPHFTTLCFDQKGRRCRNGGDFQRAEDEGAFPVWWVWPDQIAELIMVARHRQAAEAEAKAREAVLESLLREAAMGLACLSFKPLDTDIAQAAPLVARINAALAKEPEQCPTCKGVWPEFCSDGFHAPKESDA